jgi:hypothetical protein
MEINTIRYVFGAKKPELRRLVVKYGLPPAKNEQDLWHKTNYLIAKFQKEMLKDIAYIHPDRELILWSTESNEPKVSKNSSANGDENEEQSNCYGNPCNCGLGIGKKPCGCGCATATSNVGGQTEQVATPPQQQVGGTAASLPPQQQVVPQVQIVEKIQAGSFQETLKNNMPLVVVGSLLLVGGLILFGNRQMS